MPFSRLALLSLAFSLLLGGCASSPEAPGNSLAGKTVCDSYLVLSMCVRDITGDGAVDMIYFTDTNETFMYRSGQREKLAGLTNFHRCAVPLNPGMQATTNRILNRADLTLSEELEITRELIRNYAAAKPSIDACNAQYEDTASQDISATSDFASFEPDWDSE